SMELVTIKTLWGNSSFDYALSSSLGNSGGILCVWEPTLFVKDNITLSDNFLAVIDLTEKRVLWDYILHLINRWDGDCVIMGDFNEVRTEQERYDPVFNGQEDLALYDSEGWNNPRDFANPVKAISLPQDVPMNKITSSCEICSGPHDTQYCMENPEQTFVEYASSRTDEARGLVSNFMASQDARLSKFEADFKQQQSEMTNKIDTVLKAITDQIA
ncbi:MAK10-like protein, partial [Tanacetum coccineum]